MSRLRALGWVLLAAATLAAVLATQLLHIPEPTGATVIERAEFQVGDGPRREVTLPAGAADRETVQRADPVRYFIRFDLPAVPDQPLFLLTTGASQSFSVALNGETIFRSDLRAIWAEPLVRSSSLIRLPRAQLRAGANEVTFTFAGDRRIMPNYLSRIFIGHEAALAPNFKLRTILENDLKIMALAAQALLGIGILIAFFCRPRDPLFRWLAAATLLSFVVSGGLVIHLNAELRFLRPYLVALIPSVGMATLGVALTLIEVRVPRSLTVAIVAVTAVALLIAQSGVLSNVAFVSLSTSIAMIAFAGASGIIAWGAFKRNNTDAQLMLAPIFLLFWFSTRDVGIVLGWIDGSILLAPYVRALVLAAILAVLMRRLASSLDRLDRANETLHARLAAREAELAEAHRKEQGEAARLVREQERQRLTHDLHDGISGHLVSIIAMAERAGGDTKPIEQAAREALDDLRLVIYSLDLGDRELPLALANIRERLIPRLQRAGIELDWSTAELPEIEGVTPGNALTVLRILQEAITNAIKHGPARRITVRAGEAAGGMAAITIENDGAPYSAPQSTGHGIDNMRRRARQLGGELHLTVLSGGLKVTLVLPRRLPSQNELAN